MLSCLNRSLSREYKRKKSDTLYLRSLFNDLEIKARKKGGTRERKTLD
jgi:hypothetical protein